MRALTEYIYNTQRMKTNTVDLTYLESLFSTEGAICIHGLKVTEPSRDTRAVVLGEYSPTGRIVRVHLCKIEPVTVENHLIKDGHPINTQRGAFIAQPRTESQSILVRITTKTENNLGLVAEDWDDTVSMICSGHGFCGKSKNKWTDSLFVIPPFKTVMIKDAQGETRFVVINNGGDASIVTWQEYEIFFLPHIEATDKDASDAFTTTASHVSGNNTGARTRREQVTA